MARGKFGKTSKSLKILWTSESLAHSCTKILSTSNYCLFEVKWNEWMNELTTIKKPTWLKKKSWPTAKNIWPKNILTLAKKFWTPPKNIWPRPKKFWSMSKEFHPSTHKGMPPMLPKPTTLARLSHFLTDSIAFIKLSILPSFPHDVSQTIEILNKYTWDTCLHEIKNSARFYEIKFLHILFIFLHCFCFSFEIKSPGWKSSYNQLLNQYIKCYMCVCFT